MIKAILTDIDDTIYDYDRANKAALDSMYLEVIKHKHVEREEFEKLFKRCQEEIKKELVGSAASHNRILYFQRLSEKLLNTVEPKMILALNDAYWGTFWNNMYVFPGSIAFFEEVKSRGIKVVAVTNQTAFIQLKKVNQIGLNDYIDALVTSEEAGVDKPHPSMFLYGLHKANCLPQDAIMIGDDQTSDIEGANAIGMTTVRVVIGTGTVEYKSELNKPTYEVYKIYDVLQVLDKL